RLLREPLALCDRTRAPRLSDLHRHAHDRALDRDDRLGIGVAVVREIAASSEPPSAGAGGSDAWPSIAGALIRRKGEVGAGHTGNSDARRRGPPVGGDRRRVRPRGWMPFATLSALPGRA